MTYQPPFTLSPKLLNQVAEISEQLGRLSLLQEQEQSNSSLRLRRINRIRTIQGTLAIEGNMLSEQQVTAILEDKPVVAPPREIKEASNALKAYEQFEQWHSGSKRDLLKAHQILMLGLIDDAGQYRHKGVGVMKGKQVVHMAPQADRVDKLMQDLLAWLDETEVHPLVASSIFHYQFEFIHPFSDGNGRLGRLWQTLILSEWKPVFKYLPVESMVSVNQADYYKAIKQSSIETDAAPFIEFMLRMILDACQSVAIQDNSQDSPQVTPQVAPQVKELLKIMQGEMSREQLQSALGLKDRKSFRERYLIPALAQGLIEMTIPKKPNSSLQKYRLTQ
jgi:Fic family protein